ncbi:TonB-dependent receptor [Sphingobium yanoikuyae]|uniref:TonB-dependent receptor n=1 Tax=Sphingobium yanoikuyae TaxID=13690 RepID=A0AA42WSR5_SPHYA|nr:TonB-dependent receptor [Sphingobium yanoikuyae]MDH2130960.1 TonB-dependent receptor [Sphingobium yanoikuyae]MDH2164871.1 TonB-dependent receptor [Sphingobium yanoikuyae]
MAFRSSTVRSIILLSTTALTAAPALAQSAYRADEIVVTGYQRQNAQSVEEKRQRDYEADFLTNDETGQQPDFNVADSLRRLPGVDTVFDEDEGRYVAIRGLNPDYTYGSLDGAGLASSERNNRRLNMEAIPTTAIKRSEVRKSRTPDMEGSAIGGAIDLTTRSAFDSRGTYLVGNAYVGTYDSTSIPVYGDTPGYFGKGHAPGSNGMSMRAAGTFSTRFGSGDVFGIVASGSFLRRQRDQNRYQPSSWTQRGDYYVPASYGVVGYPLSSERWSAFGKLEYKPDDHLYAAITYAQFEQNEREYRYLGNYYTRGTITTSADGISKSSAGQAYASFNDFPDDKPMTTVNGVVRWAPNDVSTVDARASWSRAKFYEPTNALRFVTTNNNTNLGSSVDVSGDTPVLSINNPGYYANPANYNFSYYQPQVDDNVDTVKEAEVNYGYNVGKGDTGFGVRVGGKFRRTDRVFDHDQVNYALAPGVSLNMQNFFGGTYSIMNTTMATPAIDIQKFYEYFQANPQNFVATVPADTSDYAMREDVAAAYVAGSYKQDGLSVIFGLRGEKTDTRVVRPSIDAQGAMTTVTRKGGYTNWLPSVTGYYDLAPQLRLRASYFKGVGRPNPNQLAAGERYSVGEDGEVATVSRGNPNLKPRSANSYSAAIEYYFPGNEGVISAALFRKEVKNDIFTGRTKGEFNGEEVDFVQPQNMTKATVDGIELNLVKNHLNFLPGPLKNLGISANWTHMRGKSGVVMADGSTRQLDYMTEQPRHLMNMSVFYKIGPFQARATYAHKARYMTTINLDTNGARLDRFDRPYDQLDLQVRIKANSRLELIGEARNLTDATRVNYQGLSDQLVRDYNYTGRAFWVGASFKL